jgi:hypothetical protein
MSDTPTPQPEPEVDPGDAPNGYEHEEHEEHEETSTRTSVPDDFDPERGDDNEED